MTTRNNKQEAPKEQINKKQKTKPGNNPNKGQQENSAVPDSDMEPDEFLAPNADTDVPIDHHVANDSVLRGEDHANEKVDNLPSEDK
ncbi:hypothetical protein A3860_21095 [Niastella vici]|uniref:Uncharacterized protein n=1 Tax=Niastella vici TaxID=1703345 RepID=A0A1V9G1N4_9BACT|nr:hypothetical protein [Niastella vici]OQP64467.1 hypothetical protein A3860_21095 [Niastella vici]